MELFELLFNWKELASRGVDAVAYFAMAGIGTLLFLIKLGMALMGGDADADGDFDVDHEVETESAFTLFSLLSILAFFMGAGWMGLACRIDWGLGRLPSTFISAGFGAAMMLAASGLTYAMRRLNQTVEYDLATAVGKTARVYLTIPAKGDGHGQVEVSVSGRRKVLRARSAGPKFEAFADVRVIEVQDDGCLVVDTSES